MGTIFVAYGERDGRTEILEFALDQATRCDHEVFVYHIQEAESESVDEVRTEIETTVQERDAFLVYDIEIERVDGRAGSSARSKQELLLEAIFESDRDFDYVVMGEIRRGPLEGITHSSMTEAVLKTHDIPVTLVPI